MKFLFEANGKNFRETYEKVLISVGRVPYTEGLGLENTRVGVDEKGFIETDSQRRTADAGIFAIGDVAGEPMLAHKATYEAKIVAEVITGAKTQYDPRAVPAVIFTDPEIAWCGVTESEAKEAGMEVDVSKFPWAASGRALTLNRTDGLTKIIAHRGTRRVVGVGIVGTQAGNSYRKPSWRSKWALPRRTWLFQYILIRPLPRPLWKPRKEYTGQARIL